MLNTATQWGKKLLKDQCTSQLTFVKAEGTEE